MHKINFKPEFEKKLNALGIREKFVSNFVTHNKPSNIKGILNRLDEDIEWYNFISSAFVWSNSSEDFEFWYNIARNDI